MRISDWSSDVCSSDLHFLREQQMLTGAHIGCETTHCGACTVDMDGKSVKSCTVFAVQAEGAAVTTIEGMAAPDGTLHALQEGFGELHGLQCGFCTPDIGRASWRGGGCQDAWMTGG